jgi:NADP-reducing hydrogenase subunit HndB
VKLEDLKKAVEGDRKVELEEGEARYTVAVAMGTCGVSAGARDVLAALMDELADRDINDVIVTQTGCMGMCDREPMFEVRAEDEPTVIYGDMTGEKTRLVVAEHLAAGRPVNEYVVERKDRVEK